MTSGSGVADVPCDTADLAITLTNSSAAGGNVGGYVMFVNTSDVECSLRGAPTFVAIAASGVVTNAREATTVGMPFPGLEVPPIVTLAPGDRAFAAYGGTDNPVGGAATCPPPFHTFRIGPPGGSSTVDLPAFNAWLGQDQPSCSGISVTAIASDAQVQQYADLSALRP